MTLLPLELQTCRRRSLPTPRASAALGTALLLTLAGCSEGSIPVLRGRAGDAPSAVATPAAGTDPVAAQCEQLRAQIRSNQQAVREAPTISTSPEIVAAAQAKGDKRIDDTRARLDELNCPSDHDASVKPPRPLAPLPPAPGAPNP
jgi:hypothetical protein